MVTWVKAEITIEIDHPIVCDSQEEARKLFESYVKYLDSDLKWGKITKAVCETRDYEMEDPWNAERKIY